MTFAFLTRALHECGGDLSAALAAEAEYIRTYRTDLDFLRGLEFARHYRLLSPILRLPLPLSTAVFINMGDITPLRGFRWEGGAIQVGDARCLHLSGATAVRPGTHAAFSLCRLGDQLVVGLRSLLSEAAERALLEDFSRRLLGDERPAPR